MASTRIENIRIEIITGERGHASPVAIRFNDFDLSLNRISGGTGAGESYEGEFFVNSVVHSCALVGPAEGGWDVKDLNVEFDHGDDHSARHAYGAFSIEAGEEKDILEPPPPPVFEV
ncbi:MAG: hypothetical protein CMJ83_18560 [Planctomycetes bacterium]|nr:hypothetical protein [Planctomycetota bacterium]